VSDATRRIPVIVGVGQVNDRTEDTSAALDSLGLMEAAVRAADDDACGGWLTRLDSLAIVEQISMPELGDVSAPLAARLDVVPRICYRSALPSGDSPIRLLNEAANRIGTGEVSVAAVVGGEALRTAARRAAAAPGGGTLTYNAVRARSMRKSPRYQQRYGLVAPVDVYPLYENACRAVYGQTLDQGQEESAAIWSRFSQVAAANPAAWLRTAMSTEEIRTVSRSNRLIAFPYCKLMVANSSVNQGAAFIVTSLSEALARGIAEDRLIYVGQGAAAHEDSDVLARATFAESPSMAVSLKRALERNALSLEDLDFVELYSCFPCVPKMARRVIGWPLQKPATVSGGLTFGGGPVGNYMSHAVASMVAQLRNDGRNGLLFANGGLATNNHSIALSRRPFAPGSHPQDFDCQIEADALRVTAPSIDENYLGRATIETYTVLYDRDGGPRQGVVVARSPRGARFLAKVPATDSATLRWLTGGAEEPVGSSGVATLAEDGDTVWRL
jgi:acetyl-CoA C-acetyltransferase